MRIIITQFNKKGEKVRSWIGDMIGGKMSRSLQRCFIEAAESGGQRVDDVFKLSLVDEDGRIRKRDDTVILDDPKDMINPIPTQQTEALRAWFINPNKRKD